MKSLNKDNCSLTNIQSYNILKSVLGWSQQTYSKILTSYCLALPPSHQYSKAIFCKKNAYNEINPRENSDGPVSSPVSIGQNSSNERSKITSPLPCGNVCSSGNVSLVQFSGEVSDQIPSNTIVSQPLTTFITKNERTSFPISCFLLQWWVSIKVH